MMYLVAEANKMNDAKIRDLIASTVASDIQFHIDANDDIAIACPEFGSIYYKKNGKRNGIQRYACKDCGHRFTSFPDTILEKIYYSWDVWVAITQAMMNNISIGKTIQILQDDYHCADIDKDTVWTMRMKVMYAINQMKTFQPRMFASGFATGKKIVFIDTETTGTNKQYDEVLSLAVVNIDGEVLYDGMFKP